MKIHYLNCGTMHPRGASLFVAWLDRSPAICILLETGDRLVLVDAGFGTRDMEDLSRLGRGANLILNPQPDPEQPAVRQIARLGFDPGSVTDIICTHLDRDHAGGLSDFPQARVHVLKDERDAVLKPVSPREKERYRSCHFTHGPRWVTYEGVSGEKWFGMDCVSQLEEIPPGVVLVPLPGHTRGHAGVAVSTKAGWVLHCGDAYYVQEELRASGRVPLGVRAFRRFAHMDISLAMRSLDWLRRFSREHESRVKLIASHDQFAYRSIFGKPLD